MAVFDDLIAMSSPTLIERDLHRLAGASWEVRQYVNADGVAVSFTGCTGTCQIKSRDGTLLLALTVALTTGLVTLTAAPTATAPLAAGNYVYDVAVVNGSARRLALMGGRFSVSKGITA